VVLVETQLEKDASYVFSFEVSQSPDPKTKSEIKYATPLTHNPEHLNDSAAKSPHNCFGPLLLNGSEFRDQGCGV